jgi:hypothetical protein
MITAPQPSGVTNILTTRCRWYYLNLKNERRNTTSATDVQVYLVQIGIPGIGGDYIEFSTGRIPLALRNEGLRRRLTVGPSLEWDLCCVSRDYVLQGVPAFQLRTTIETTIAPNVVLGSSYSSTQPYKVRLTFIAVSAETDSNDLCIEIIWDGQWSENNQQMEGHLKITKCR